MIPIVEENEWKEKKKGNRDYTIKKKRGDREAGQHEQRKKENIWDSGREKKVWLGHDEVLYQNPQVLPSSLQTIGEETLISQGLAVKQVWKLHYAACQ